VIECGDLTVRNVLDADNDGSGRINLPVLYLRYMRPLATNALSKPSISAIVGAEPVGKKRHGGIVPTNHCSCQSPVLGNPWKI
jgi:hypothetical protein